MPRQSNAVVRISPRGAGMRYVQSRKYLGTQVGEPEIKLLRDLVEYDGIANTARAVGISPPTLLAVMAGLIHHCRPSTQHIVRAFFAEGGDDTGA